MSVLALQRVKEQMVLLYLVPCVLTTGAALEAECSAVPQCAADRRYLKGASQPLPRHISPDQPRSMHCQSLRLNTLPLLKGLSQFGATSVNFLMSRETSRTNLPFLSRLKLSVTWLVLGKPVQCSSRSGKLT